MNFFKTIPKTPPTFIVDPDIWEDVLQTGGMVCMAKVLSTEEISALILAETERLKNQGFPGDVISENMLAFESSLMALKENLRTMGKPK